MGVIDDGVDDHPAVGRDPMAVGPQLRMLLPTLTPAEWTVADWFLRRENFTKSPTIGEVATALGVSEPFLVKVARRLGYPGFKALRTALLAYHSIPQIEMHQDLSRDDSVSEIKRKIFQATRQVLDEVQSITPSEVIEEAAEAFYAGKQRDIYGVGGSATVCHDASHKFLRIGIRSTVFSDTHMMMMSASLLSKEDVVLAVSHSGQTMELLGAIDLARTNGARIIALTNSFASDLAKASDFVLCAPAKDSPLIGQNATARIAQLTLIDSFFMCLARKNYDLAEANLNKTMSSIHCFPWTGVRKGRAKPRN